MRISDWSSDVCSSDLDHSGRTVTNDSLVPIPLMPSAAHGAVYRGTRWRRDEAPCFAAAESAPRYDRCAIIRGERGARSEEHTSELQSLMRISYAVFCLKKKSISQPTLGAKDTKPFMCRRQKTQSRNCKTNTYRRTTNARHRI